MLPIRLLPFVRSHPLILSISVSDWRFFRRPPILRLQLLAALIPCPYRSWTPTSTAGARRPLACRLAPRRQSASKWSMSPPGASRLKKAPTRTTPGWSGRILSIPHSLSRLKRWRVHRHELVSSDRRVEHSVARRPQRAVARRTGLHRELSHAGRRRRAAGAVSPRNRRGLRHHDRAAHLRSVMRVVPEIRGFGQ